ncbi:MAG: hypothetical protein ABI775_10325 [Pseudonocardiales bacterium]
MSSSEGLSAVGPVPGPAAPPTDGERPTSGKASPPTDPAPELSPERIAERVAVLDAVAELPLAEHVELYQRLHAELQSALAEIDGP